jgi:hypothetical protein
MESEGSMPHSQQPASCPYPESHQSSHVSNTIPWIFYGDKLLEPRPIPKLDDHPISAVHA